MRAKKTVRSKSWGRLSGKRLRIKFVIKYPKEKKVRRKLCRMQNAAMKASFRCWPMKQTIGARKRWERRNPITTFFTPMCPMQYQTMKAM